MEFTGPKTRFDSGERESASKNRHRFGVPSGMGCGMEWVEGQM